MFSSKEKEKVTLATYDCFGLITATCDHITVTISSVSVIGDELHRFSKSVEKNLGIPLTVIASGEIVIATLATTIAQGKKSSIATYTVGAKHPDLNLGEISVVREAVTEAITRLRQAIYPS